MNAIDEDIKKMQAELEAKNTIMESHRADLAKEEKIKSDLEIELENLRRELEEALEREALALAEAEAAAEATSQPQKPHSSGGTTGAHSQENMFN